MSIKMDERVQIQPEDGVRLALLGGVKYFMGKDLARKTYLPTGKKLTGGGDAIAVRLLAGKFPNTRVAMHAAKAGTPGLIENGVYFPYSMLGAAIEFFEAATTKKEVRRINSREEDYLKKEVRLSETADKSSSSETNTLAEEVKSEAYHGGGENKVSEVAASSEPNPNENRIELELKLNTSSLSTFIGGVERMMEQVSAEVAENANRTDTLIERHCAEISNLTALVSSLGARVERLSNWVERLSNWADHQQSHQNASKAIAPMKKGFLHSLFGF